MTAVGTVVVVVVVVDVVLVELVLVELVSTVTAGACVVVVVLSAFTNAGALKPKNNTTRVVAIIVRRISSTLLTESPCRTAVVQ